MGCVSAGLLRPGRLAYLVAFLEAGHVDWDELEVGKICSGQVVRIERYGVFVDIGAERPGLLHVREMGQYVRNPADFVKMGETVEVKILKLDRRKRQIDFTMQLESEDLNVDEDEEPALSAMEIAFRQAQMESDIMPKGRNRRAKRKGSKREYDDIYRYF